MNWKRAARYALVSLVFASGCSSMPGLRVLTGEDTGGDNVNRSVQALDLVMADKTGGTDPALILAGDRIESADSQVDVIEIRPDLEKRLFKVAMLLNLPQTPNTPEGAAAQADAFRRAFELTWQSVMPLSVGADKIEVDLLFPQQVTTLDSGPSFVAHVAATAEIERADAAVYLTGTRSLDSFFGLIVDGKLSYTENSTFMLYSGKPNHPMFMLQPTDTTAS